MRQVVKLDDKQLREINRALGYIEGAVDTAEMEDSAKEMIQESVSLIERTLDAAEDAE